MEWMRFFFVRRLCNCNRLLKEGWVTLVDLSLKIFIIFISRGYDTTVMIIRYYLRYFKVQYNNSREFSLSRSVLGLRWYS
jgi:hypothetical protein